MIKILLAAGVIISVSCAFLFGQGISLSGKMLDEENNPLTQATVTLAKVNSVVSTDAQGVFKIIATSIIVNDITGMQPVALVFSKGTCRFTSPRTEPLDLKVYDLKGTLHMSTNDMLVAGRTCSYTLVSDTKSAGIYLVCFSVGKENYTVKYSPEQLQQRRFFLSPTGAGLQSASSGCREKAWSDTLIFQKSGFITQRWPVRNQTDTATVHMVTPATDAIEKQMFKLINDHRTGMSLKTLVWSDVAANYVRVHSRNVSKGITPFGHDGFTARVDAVATKTILWEPCENIVAGYGTAQSALNAWLGSSGHKENIENGTVNISGIGYYKGSGTYSNVYTQIFYFCNLIR